MEKIYSHSETATEWPTQYKTGSFLEMLCVLRTDCQQRCLYEDFSNLCDVYMGAALIKQADTPRRRLEHSTAACSAKTQSFSLKNFAD